MPPKIKKNCGQKAKVPPDRVKNQKGTEEKENECSNVDLKQVKGVISQVEVRFSENKIEESNKVFAEPLVPKVPLKPSGFWSKKLQALEENETKIKKCALYEFSGTDESDTSFKVKKKPKQNARVRKKRQPLQPKYGKVIDKIKREKKIKQTNKQTLDKEKITLSSNKETKKLAEEEEKFTFSTTNKTLGITSTPAVNKGNLIGASNFLFLSPIIKEDAEYCNSITECSPVGLKVLDRSPLSVHSNKNMPRPDTKVKQLSCRRVLRSGKTLGT